jgi:uncharacterized cupin superfamily protein
MNPRRKRSAILVLLSMLACGAPSAEEETNMTSPGIIDISTATPADLAMQPVEDAPYMRVVEGEGPAYGSREDFVSADGRLRVDYSRYTTQTLKLERWPADEFMYFIEGRVEITTAGGESRVYGPGDMILMPRGFTGTWRQLSPIRKISVTYAWGE